MARRPWHGPLPCRCRAALGGAERGRCLPRRPAYGLAMLPQADSLPALRVNRAPVLTLWAAVVAERLGYPEETALTLGRAVAGASAQAKARHLGIAEERPG